MPARVPMTAAQREALLALPDAEELLVRHHSLDERDLAAVNTARTPETRLGYALQLCCLRYPGRHLRRGELLPGPMLSHIAEQIDVDAAVIAGFARRVSDRRLYAFEPAKRYGALASLFGHRLNRDLITSHWSDIHRVTDAIGARTVVPSLILKKLSAYRQQNSLAAALREVGRIERTLFTLRWFKDPALRQLVTAELNKGEARNSLARAVAFHRLGRFRDRGLENQQLRSSALTLVTAAIILFNCRYLGRAIAELQRRV